MLWAGSGGSVVYPGVVSLGDGYIRVEHQLQAGNVQVLAGGSLEMLDTSGHDLLIITPAGLNKGLRLKYGLGLFDTTPPASPTTGGAHTAGGTYTAVEQGMLEACYTALQSIGLVT